MTDSIRLFLHVIGASVWVGGQLILAALVPFLRNRGRDLPKLVAQKFNRVAWPAYFLLLATGFWNVDTLARPLTSNYRTALIIKMVVVLFSGVAAFLHTKSRSSLGLAFWGAISGLAALMATYLGVLLAG